MLSKSSQVNIVCWTSSYSVFAEHISDKLGQSDLGKTTLHCALIEVLTHVGCFQPFFYRPGVAGIFHMPPW